MIWESIIDEIPVVDFMRQRIVALKDPYETFIAATELRIIDQVIEAMGPMNGIQVTELSHTEPGWIQANSQDNIEYEIAWMPPVAEQFWARWRAKDYEN